MTTMSNSTAEKRSTVPPDVRPWYREPWPWVLIALPLSAVIASFFSLYLAIANPDYMVADDQELDRVKAELRAQPVPKSDGER